MKSLIFLLISLTACNFTAQDSENKLFLKIKENGFIYIGNRSVPDLSELSRLINSSLNLNTSNKTIIINLSIEDKVHVERVFQIKNVLKEFREQTIIEVIKNNSVTRIKLPPLEEAEPDFKKLKKRNLLFVKVFNDSLLVNNKLKSLNKLKTLSYKFLKNDVNNPSSPEQFEKNLPKIGSVKCNSKTIIILEHGSATQYQQYFEVFNLLKESYLEAWDEYSQKYFNTDYKYLDKTDQMIIKDILPFVIIEI